MSVDHGGVCLHPDVGRPWRNMLASWYAVIMAEYACVMVLGDHGGVCLHHGVW